jgi:dTDP-4-dehydrorhamnose reductase
MKKVFTLGAGFVSEHLPYHVVNHRISSPDDIGHIINTLKPDVLVNCIGKTGRPNVDWCESHKEETATGNTALPIMLADACGKHSIHLVQIGSGCIYFGPSPCKGHISSTPDPGWREDDFANPKSFYSKSKYACDLMLGQMNHVTTLRIRMPISTKDNPRNLINKLRGYSKVIDIPNSMTFMDDLTRCVDWAIQGRHTGIYHVTNPQPITAARIMKEYQKYVPEHTFSYITEAELDQMTIAKRSNCILSTQKLTAAGFQMTNSEDALVQCMGEYVKNVRRNNVK